jgi:hypothetical protein
LRSRAAPSSPRTASNIDDLAHDAAEKELGSHLDAAAKELAFAAIFLAAAEIGVDVRDEPDPIDLDDPGRNDA